MRQRSRDAAEGEARSRARRHADEPSASDRPFPVHPSEGSQFIAYAAPVLDAEREAVARAGRRLATEGLVLGTAGNVSARAGDLVAITPTGVVLAEVEPEDIAIVDLEGGLVEGRFEPSSEVGLHLGVHSRYRPGAVVHTHQPVATALSCVIDELPCVHYQMLLLGGAVRVAPYATFGTPELADEVIRALDGRTAALMANHGAVVTASEADAAVESALLLEWACSVYWRAAAIGSPRALGEEAQGAVVEAALARGYGTKKPVAGADG
jgi:L-fuculose-phosphate aldolase